MSGDAYPNMEANARKDFAVELYASVTCGNPVDVHVDVDVVGFLSQVLALKLPSTSTTTSTTTWT